MDKELRTKRLFPSVRKGKDAPLPYGTHNKRDKELFEKLDIYIMKKTHASRVYAARAGDEAGLSDEVCSSSGSHCQVVQEYLHLIADKTCNCVPVGNP